MIGYDLPGIVTQAASIVLRGLVFGARLPVDSEKSMSLTQHCGKNAPLFRLSAISDIIYFHFFLQKNLLSKIDMSGGSHVSQIAQAIML